MGHVSAPDSKVIIVIAAITYTDNTSESAAKLYQHVCRVNLSLILNYKFIILFNFLILVLLSFLFL